MQLPKGGAKVAIECRGEATRARSSSKSMPTPSSSVSPEEFITLTDADIAVADLKVIESQVDLANVRLREQMVELNRLSAGIRGVSSFRALEAPSLLDMEKERRRLKEETKFLRAYLLRLHQRWHELESGKSA